MTRIRAPSAVNIATLASRRRLLAGGQREDEAGATLGPVLGPDPPTVCLDQAPRHRQSQSGPLPGASGRPAPIERLEHCRQRFASGMPGPLSATLTSTRSSVRSETRDSDLASGVYFIAFSTRFVTTWSIST